MAQKRLLPREYIQLENLESTGTQHIDTGFSPNLNTKIEYQLQFTTIQGGSQPIIGTRVGSYNESRFFPLAEADRAGIGRTVLGNSYNNLSINADTIYTGEFIPRELKTVINGTTYTFSNPGFIKTQNNNIYLFGTSGYGTEYWHSIGRIWYVRIYDNDTLVRNFIPAKRRSDNVLGMYDLVTDTFFTNAGTGDFIAGPEVSGFEEIEVMKRCMVNGESILPSGYTELEYIQSSGTQLIKSGYIFNSATDTLEVQYENMSGTTSYKWGFGSYVSGSSSIGVTTGIDAASQNLYYNTARSVSSSYFSGKHTFLADSNGGSIDGANVASFLNFTSNSALFLFGVNGGSANNKGSYKIYSYKHTRNGSTLLNLIPAKNSSNVIGMYDLVSDTFFTNQGTGDFIAGPEVQRQTEYTIYKQEVLDS